MDEHTSGAVDLLLREESDSLLAKECRKYWQLCRLLRHSKLPDDEANVIKAMRHLANISHPILIPRYRNIVDATIR